MDEQWVEELLRSGTLAEEWEKSFRSVGREEFLPETLWAQRDGDGLYERVRRDEDPMGWRDLAEGSGPVVTQVDDGHPAGPGGLGVVATSSVCSPGLVALMLGQVEAELGDRVLQIGTGTGWMAALLAHRLGADRVTTVEVDPGVAAHARRALGEAGFGEVIVVTGNGSAGWPGEGPYHRVISTAACHTVPYPWVAQTRPGGRIVTPWAPEFGSWALVALDVADDHTATGAVVAPAETERLRDQRLPPLVVPGLLQHKVATSRTTWLTPDEIMLTGDVLMAMSMWLPNCQARYRPPSPRNQHTATLVLSDHRTSSWARLRVGCEEDAEPCTVVQGGQRWLFDELERVYQRWIAYGRPRFDSWLIVVDEDGQRIEITS